MLLKPTTALEIPQFRRLNEDLFGISYVLRRNYNPTFHVWRYRFSRLDHFEILEVIGHFFLLYLTTWFRWGVLLQLFWADNASFIEWGTKWVMRGFSALALNAGNSERVWLWILFRVWNVLCATLNMYTPKIFTWFGKLYFLDAYKMAIVIRNLGGVNSW